MRNNNFTGLKNEPLEPSIALADKALESGSADELIDQTTVHVAAQLRKRFAAASEARKHSSNSVTAGREYVARYIEFIHYVEQLRGGIEGTHPESSANTP